MYVRKFWEVLVVDDEPDVHAVTKLVLESMDVWGVPLRVRHAHSAAEAKKALSDVSGEIASDLAVALIDVVMESDTAGLELCRYIREEQKNRVTELIVRTGQAGKAPERSVIDRYDISGYITKVEATEDRLYTLVKSGVRQFLLMRATMGMRAITNATISMFVAHGRKESALLGEVLPKLLSRTSSTPDGKQLSGLESHVAFIIDGQVYGVGDYADRQAVEKKRNELVAQPPTEKNALGEQRLYGQDVLLTLAPGDRSVEMIARHGFTNLPEFLILPSMDWMVTVRHLLGMATR